MLTRQQLQRIAQRDGIGLQAQERDYVQNLLLALVYARSQSMIFKGGTALRIVHRGGRYSEDLDFNAATSPADAQRLWTEVVSDLERYGIAAEMREAWQGEEAYSFDVSYRGPLYDGRDRTKGKVRVDLSLRREAVETVREFVSPGYDDVRPFIATVLTPEHPKRLPGMDAPAGKSKTRTTTFSRPKAIIAIRHALGTRRTFFQDLETLSRYVPFDDWAAVWAFMFHGLDLDTG